MRLFEYGYKWFIPLYCPLPKKVQICLDLICFTPSQKWVDLLFNSLERHIAQYDAHIALEQDHI